MFLDIMRRHKDWSVVVALVGNGQEINTGEAGLSAWGEALLQRPDWHIHAAQVATVATNPRQRLFTGADPKVTINPDLHLRYQSARSSRLLPRTGSTLF